MKINNIYNNKQLRLQNNDVKRQKMNNKTLTNYVDSSIAKSAYNIAFMGLKQPAKSMPVYDLRENVHRNFRLNPQARYLVSDDTIFSLGRFICPDINLQNPIIQKTLNGMSIGDEITIGTEGDIKAGNMSRLAPKHIKLTKASNNTYIAQDLSKIGTSIFGFSKPTTKLKYAEDYSHIHTQERALKPNVPTLIPNDAQIILGNNFVVDPTEKRIQNRLKTHGTIKIGRNDDCDFKIRSFADHVSRDHLLLQSDGKYLVATDLGSRNGTKIVPREMKKAFINGTENLRFSQSNIGDCALLSTLYAISTTPKGAELLSKMVTIDANGDYVVTFNNCEPIIVHSNEIEGQRAKEGYIRSVEGDYGIKAIERAFAKKTQKFFHKNELDSTINNGMTFNFVLKNLVGTKFEKISTKHHEKEIEDILRKIPRANFLENVIITCSSKQKGEYGKEKNYVDAEQRFIKAHGYVLAGVDLKSDCAIIVNPHNTAVKHYLPIKDFCNIFDGLYMAELK